MDKRNAITDEEWFGRVNEARERGGLPPFFGWRKDGTPIWEIRGGGDGFGFRDVRDPQHNLADETAVTLSTTMLGLVPDARGILPANYWKVGKLVKITAFGKATTDGTAGNYVFEMSYGAGAAPAKNVQGATVAGTVSQTNISWRAEGWAECRAIGTGGIFRMWGHWTPAVALLASTLQPYIFPASAPADITSVDTTVGTNALNFQLQRSGAGVWTATTTNFFVEALN